MGLNVCESAAIRSASFARSVTHKHSTFWDCRAWLCRLDALRMVCQSVFKPWAGPSKNAPCFRQRRSLRLRLVVGRHLLEFSCNFAVLCVFAPLREPVLTGAFTPRRKGTQSRNTTLSFTNRFR